MSWRHLRANELDHEALWLGVSATALAAAGAWTALGWPTPQCAFHTVTGWPCPGCGATRAFVQLTHGAWASALALNPLACVCFAAVVGFDVYAAFALLTRGPRWRWTSRPRDGRWLRAAGIAVVCANWAWLVRMGV